MHRDITKVLCIVCKEKFKLKYLKSEERKWKTVKEVVMQFLIYF